MIVSVSFLKSNYDTKTTIKKIDDTSADYIHVDMMDGKFVKEKNYTIGEFTKFFSNTSKPLDVHLMTMNPLKYLEAYASLNTEFITFHLEAVSDVQGTIDEIKNLGLKVGISIKPKTSIKKIEPYLTLIDQVLVMSVEPGKGGQVFMESSLTKIEKLVELRTKNNYSYLINVDGGINEETFPLVHDVEVDMVVSGSYICMSDNFEKQIESLRQ